MMGNKITFNVLQSFSCINRMDKVVFEGVSYEEELHFMGIYVNEDVTRLLSHPCSF